MTLGEHINLSKSFADSINKETHMMWHAGAAKEDVRTRVNDRLYASWRNLGHRDRPPRLVIMLFKRFRWSTIRVVYGPQGCKYGYLAACQNGTTDAVEDLPGLQRLKKERGIRRPLSWLRRGRADRDAQPQASDAEPQARQARYSP